MNTLTNICELLKDAYSRNWITSRDGNISWHPEGASYFYITPSGVRKQDMTPELFKKIDITTLAELDDNLDLRASGEIHLHHRLIKQTQQRTMRSSFTPYLHCCGNADTRVINLSNGLS